MEKIQQVVVHGSLVVELTPGLQFEPNLVGFFIPKHRNLGIASGNLNRLLIFPVLLVGVGTIRGLLTENYGRL